MLHSSWPSLTNTGCEEWPVACEGSTNCMCKDAPQRERAEEIKSLGWLRASAATPQILSRRVIYMVEGKLGQRAFPLTDSTSSSWSFPGGKMTVSLC